MFRVQVRKLQCNTKNIDVEFGKQLGDYYNRRVIKRGYITACKQGELLEIDESHNFNLW